MPDRAEHIERLRGLHDSIGTAENPGDEEARLDEAALDAAIASLQREEERANECDPDRPCEPNDHICSRHKPTPEEPRPEVCCPTCGSGDPKVRRKVQLSPSRPYAGKWCPDKFHHHPTPADPVPESARGEGECNCGGYGPVDEYDGTNCLACAPAPMPARDAGPAPLKVDPALNPVPVEEARGDCPYCGAPDGYPPAGPCDNPRHRPTPPSEARRWTLRVCEKRHNGCGRAATPEVMIVHESACANRYKTAPVEVIELTPEVKERLDLPEGKRDD